MELILSKTAFPAADWQNPGKKFRSAPFRSWNGKLEKEELLHQIRIFKEMGMGGFLCTPASGLLLNICRRSGSR